MNLNDAANAAIAAYDAALTYGPPIIVGASTASALLPPAKEGTVWAVVRKLIDYAAINVRNAKNAPPAPAPAPKK